ncbi:hypothetical protein D4764_17G0000220 [Takifugu flavidus]|uniref:Uncharacterized protein n=1 Tax=Takifugu flavidus TaxID=433684 RepID=A0A5C6NWZ8_9TELE|nr:hypothetical protein D4764_17G0000220 [Takifugu flavidus]
MAEGGDSGDKPKATLWSQAHPRLGSPRGGAVWTPQGQVGALALQEYSEYSATVEWVGSKLTYAQVLMMPPQKRAPPPD